MRVAKLHVRCPYALRRLSSIPLILSSVLLCQHRAPPAAAHVSEAAGVSNGRLLRPASGRRVRLVYRSRPAVSGSYLLIDMFFSLLSAISLAPALRSLRVACSFLRLLTSMAVDGALRKPPARVHDGTVGDAGN